MDAVRVMLVMGQGARTDAIIDTIDRSGLARVVAVADDPSQVGAARKQEDPDVVMAVPTDLPMVASMGIPVIALDDQATTGSLRAAVEHGVAAFIEWPDQRADLLASLVRLASKRAAMATGDAHLIGVLAARGGAGATFVATHLADALARSQTARKVVLIDADLFGAGVAVATGAARIQGLRTVEDLLPVLSEVGPGHVLDVLWSHPRGFDVLLAPRSVPAPPQLNAAAVHRVIHATGELADIVVVDLPRDPAVVTAFRDGGGRALLILPLEAAAFAQGSRWLHLFPQGVAGVVVNKAARSDVTAQDAEQVFGCAPLGRIPVDRRIRAAHDQGRILSPRTSIARTFEHIASELFDLGSAA